VALELTSAMTLIPYVLVARYGLQLARRGETYEAASEEERRRDLIRAAIATVYTLFMIVTGGLKFVLLSCILFAPGTLLYYMARREQNLRVFTPLEWLLFAAVVAGDLKDAKALLEDLA
jgi:arginine:ornithine antiporter / lysine permease